MNEIILILLILGGTYSIYSINRKVIFKPVVIAVEATPEAYYPQSRTIIYSTPKLSAPESPTCMLFSEYPQGNNKRVNIAYQETNGCQEKMYNYSYNEKQNALQQYDTSFLSDRQYQHVAEEFIIC